MRIDGWVCIRYASEHGDLAIVGTIFLKQYGYVPRSGVHRAVVGVRRRIIFVRQLERPNLCRAAMGIFGNRALSIRDKYVSASVNAFADRM